MRIRRFYGRAGGYFSSYRRRPVSRETAGFGLGAGKRLWVQVVVEISPIRVGALDEVEFPLALPLLDLLFPTDRRLDRSVRLEPHQGVDAIARSEARDCLAPVLGHPLHQIRSHADVQRSIRLACQQIDVEHLQPRLTIRVRAELAQSPLQSFTMVTLANTIEIELPAAGSIPAFAGMTKDAEGSSAVEREGSRRGAVLAAHRIGDRIFEAYAVHRAPTARAIRHQRI